MIWIWIIAAVAVSYFFCRKKVRWQHYIWILLPIEMYGITIAGSVFKPYIIFGLFIFFQNILRKKYVLPNTIVCIAIMLILSDCINGLIISSILQHLLFLVILFIAYNYVIAFDGKLSFTQISYVMLATTLGYGVVFGIAYVCYLVMPSLGGILAKNRYMAGMFLDFLSSGGLVTSRFRGFCVDPNSVITTLLPGATYALANIIYRKEQKIKSFLAVLLFALVVYISGSRMALFCTLLLSIIMIVIGYIESGKKDGWIFIILMAVIGIVTYSLVSGQGIISRLIVSFNSIYNSRATLNADSGRVTIWIYNLKYLFKSGRFLFGVGQNQIYTMTALGKECHNTWLEWICGIGILGGLAIDLWFILAPIKLMKRCEMKKRGFIYNILPIVFAYCTVVICITSVDNITNSVLLFLNMIFRYGYIGWDKEDICQS
jgi:O-antigen ligase